jgi:DNA-binding MarR family transcriptional regulator
MRKYPMTTHPTLPEEPPIESTRWLGLLTQLRRVHGVMRESLGRFLAESPLHETEFLLLWQLANAPEPLAQKQLAPSIGVSPAQVSGLLERLRAANLIVGQRDPLDRRRLCWQATATGHLFVQNVLQAGQLQSHLWDQAFSPAEQDELSRQLHLLDAALTSPPAAVHHTSDRREKAA